MNRTFAIVFVLFSLCATAADWPQLLGPNRDGVSAERKLIDTFGKKGPEVAWQRDVGIGYAGPVVAGGKLYLYHRVGNEDVLESLDAATGKFGWKYSYRTNYKDPLSKGDGPRSTPVVSGGKVYLLGAGGQLHCVNAKTGKKVWAKELLAEYKVPDSYFGVGTTPLVEGDHVLVNVGGEDGAGIVAIHKDTGKEAWKATDQEASYSSPIAATIDGVRHAIFFTRRGFVSIDPKSGKVRATKRWRAGIAESVNAAAPVPLGEHVLLTTSYDTGAVLLKLKKDGVTEVWKNDKSLSCHFSTPVAVGEQLYGFHGRQDVGEKAELRCIDWKSGKLRWREGGFGCGALIAADGKLFVLSEDGDLVIVTPTPDRYTEKARATVLGKPFRSHPALADGLLYARDGKKLVCWKLKKE